MACRAGGGCLSGAVGRCRAKSSSSLNTLTASERPLACCCKEEAAAAAASLQEQAGSLSDSVGVFRLVPATA